MRFDSFAFLADALRPAAPAAAAAPAWESVVALASEQLVTPTLYRTLEQQGRLAALPDEVARYLAALHELNGLRNRRILAQLREVARLLNAAGIEPVLLKGVAYLAADLYRDPAARVVGDVDLLVAPEELSAAVAALAAAGYREVSPPEQSFAGHHHHRPLARPDDVAAVELHSAPLARAFDRLLPAERMRAGARPAGADVARWGLPAPRDLLIHNVVHSQLADRHYWYGRAPLRPLCDLVRLRREHDGALDWPGLLAGFARAGYGGAYRAWLLLAERLLGQPLPPGVAPDRAARLACWRVRQQRRHPWLMAAGAAYGFQRAMLARLGASPAERRRVLDRLLRATAAPRYLRALRATPWRR